jgi:hypothetical protein
VASVEACGEALQRLGQALTEVDAPLRERHVPARTVGCRLTDLDAGFTGRIDADGLHDLTEADPSDIEACEVRAQLTSEELLALADGRDTLLAAWMHGRLQVSAPMRDLLRLRSLIGI